jgi:hypothetical protein
MQREDLPEGYGGWQVLDPTPQERSSGRALLPSLEMGIFTHIYIYFLLQLLCVPISVYIHISLYPTYALDIMIISLNSSVFCMLR